jgi:hypothetical protein
VGEFVNEDRDAHRGHGPGGVNQQPDRKRPTAGRNRVYETYAGRTVCDFYFCTVIVDEPVSGGVAESVAVTVMV